MSNLVGALPSTGQPLQRRSFGQALHWDAELPGDLVEQLWRDPQALLAQGQTLQVKKRCVVVRLDHPQGPFLFKHHNWGGPLRTLRKSLLCAQAKQSWIDGHRLRAAGLPTPLPRACLERSFGPLGICSYLLTDYIAGPSLYRFMRFNQPSQEIVLDLARQLAQIWQRLVDLRVSHNDLKTENLLIDLSGRMWLIDLERMHRHRYFGPARRRHAEDIARLFHPRNWRTNLWAAEIFRQQLLQTPAGQASTIGAAAAVHPLCRPLPPINRPSQLVTVLIPCCNHAHVIFDCLKSVHDIADEILVVDRGSTDNTLEIVRSFGGCQIIRRTQGDQADVENSAARHARHQWILRILPGERLSPELAKETQDLLAEEPTQDGFYISRRRHSQRRKVLHRLFRRDASLRLFRYGAARCELHDGRLEVVIPSGKTGQMSAAILYESRPTQAPATISSTRPAKRATLEFSHAR